MLGVSVVPVEDVADDGTLSGWLAACGITAALVRPDGYVFGTADGDPAVLVRAVNDRLCLIPHAAAIHEGAA